MNCPKHVDFYSKNKFEKLVHLVGFIIVTLSEYNTLGAQHTESYSVELVVVKKKSYYSG